MYIAISVHKMKGPDGWQYVWNTASVFHEYRTPMSPSIDALTRHIAKVMWHDNYAAAHECVDMKVQLKAYVVFDDVPKPLVFNGIPNPETAALSSEERDTFLKNLYDHLANLDPRQP